MNDPYNRKLPLNVKYQLLYYRRKELEKKKKRKELITRTILIILILSLIYTGYYMYNSSLLQNTEKVSYTPTVPKTVVLQYDESNRPFVSFIVNINPSISVDMSKKDFSSDIKIINTGVNYNVKRLNGGTYLVVAYFDNNVPEVLSVQVLGYSFQVTVVKDVTIKLLSLKYPKNIVIGQEYTMYVVLKTSVEVKDWGAKTYGIKITGSSIKESFDSGSFIYTFIINFEVPEKMGDHYKYGLIIYSKKYSIGQPVPLNIIVQDRKLSVSFNIEKTKLMSTDEQSHFLLNITSNYNGKIYIEYKTADDSLVVNVNSTVNIHPGNNIIVGTVSMATSVNTVKETNFILIVKNEDGEKVFSKIVSILLFPPLSKIRVSPTPIGLTPDNMIQLRVDFISELKDVSAKITACTAKTDSGDTLECDYSKKLIQLKENSATSTTVYIDASKYIENRQSVNIYITLNIDFYSQGIKFPKGVTIQTEVTIGNNS